MAVKETKRERFVRLAEARTNKIIDIVFNIFVGILLSIDSKNGLITQITSVPKSPNGIIVSAHILPFILNFLSV